MHLAPSDEQRDVFYKERINKQWHMKREMPNMRFQRIKLRMMVDSKSKN